MILHYMKNDLLPVCGASGGHVVARPEDVTCKRCRDALVWSERQRQYGALWADKRRDDDDE